LEHVFGRAELASGVATSLAAPQPLAVQQVRPGQVEGDLDLITNRNSRGPQLGVNVTRCPSGATGPSGCTTAFLDTAGADRPWLATAGTHAWVAYHDAGNSSLIRVKRSTDDGIT
jgi:hypothetical protein